MGLYTEGGWLCGHPMLPSYRGLSRGPHLADVLTHIFDDHLVSCNGFHGKQTPLVDSASAKSELLLPELERRQAMLLNTSLNLAPCLSCRPPNTIWSLTPTPTYPLGNSMMLPSN